MRLAIWWSQCVLPGARGCSPPPCRRHGAAPPPRLYAARDACCKEDEGISTSCPTESHGLIPLPPLPRQAVAQSVLSSCPAPRGTAAPGGIHPFLQPPRAGSENGTRIALTGSSMASCHSRRGGPGWDVGAGAGKGVIHGCLWNIGQPSGGPQRMGWNVCQSKEHSTHAHIQAQNLDFQWHVAGPERRGGRGRGPAAGSQALEIFACKNASQTCNLWYSPVRPPPPAARPRGSGSQVCLGQRCA